MRIRWPLYGGGIATAVLNIRQLQLSEKGVTAVEHEHQQTAREEGKTVDQAAGPVEVGTE
jgi:hypothetical protein